MITIEAPPSARPGSGVADLGVHGGREARRLGLNPLHRSRRSIVVNLKKPAGLDIALRLAARSDVFVEGFRPGACDRLGLGYRALSATTPGLVYCSLTGYGQDGELAQHAGHDLNYIAESGLLSVSTRPGQKPGIPLNMAADYAAGGLLAAFGILAALTGRAATGRGTHVDVSMYEGLLGLMQVAPSWTAAGAPDPSWGGGLLSGAVPFYDCYRTADDQWISVGALEPKFFANLCAALERPDLIDRQHDTSRWDEMRAVFTEAFAGAPLATWLDRLGDVDTAVAPVRSLADAFTTAHARGVLPAPGQVGPIPRLRGWTATAGPVVTHAGAHTRQVLAELEIEGEHIDELIATGVVAE
ncbi:CaiB/BaiF CoA-transferase family protein [Pseudonocardia sp. KRD291]|uniref:CaiB/BaiF CoA transferase family protein n=1 Tax=Pseudonocardia sp. KRD291 TaxID=2792007 RepID=UPI0027E3827A|nr:CaiB/BaiF CoA-transferase family protein [Pseudonocardia sp. KRD291]